MCKICLKFKTKEFSKKFRKHLVKLYCKVHVWNEKNDDDDDDDMAGKGYFTGPI